MAFAPSKYQQAIYDFITGGQGNAVVDAVAGSGKSTTLVGAVNYIPEEQSALFLAFNKDIVSELSVKLAFNSNVIVKTLHSFGLAALRRMNPSIEIDGSKYHRELNMRFKSGVIDTPEYMDALEFNEYRNNIRKLIDLTRVNMCTAVEQFPAIADKHGLNIYGGEYEIAADLVRWGFKNTAVVDFTDMVYFPVIRKSVKVPTFQWVFIDEYQDLNAAQRALFLKAVAPDNGRFIAVGDPNQAIYGFAGADVESCKKIKALPNTKVLPLSICYRCDADIIDIANTVSENIHLEARPGAVSGTVERLSKADQVKPNDMVLCRLTAPLVSLYMTYLRQGIKAYVKGRDEGKKLIDLIEATGQTNKTHLFNALELVLNELANKISLNHACSLAEAKNDRRYVAMADMVETIEIVSAGCTTASCIVNRLKAMFQDDGRDAIILSTIHKSKGLEADRVFILRPDMLMLIRETTQDWEIVQEVNLVYVAYTRAKHFLGFLTDL